MSELRREAGGAVEDDALLLLMARRVLGGAPDDGRSSYRISLDVCTACGRGAQLAAGEAVPVSAEIVAMAACDGEVAWRGAANENATLAGGPQLSSLSNDQSQASEPGQRSARLARPTPHVGQRARQSVTPALRRAVLARDRHCCQVPGCKNHLHVDVHHIRPRADGGSNTMDNLITLCTAHHRAVHRGELLMDNIAPGQRRCRHADGSEYGSAVGPGPADANAKLFSALRQLGFREREVHAVLSELRADTALRDAPLEQLLREALCRIRHRP